MKCLINIVYHSLLVKNKKGEGKGGLEREMGVGADINFLPFNGGGGGRGLFERGGLIEDLQ